MFIFLRMKNIEWAGLEYNFTLEKSVLESQAMLKGENMEGLSINS